MVGRILIYGLMLGVLLLLATDPTVMSIGGPSSLSVPGGGLSVTDPSPIYLIPIALLVWVVLRRRRQRPTEDEYQD